MKIALTCDKEEFKRLQKIQEIFNDTFRSLVEEGFKGSLTIEVDEKC